jgi:hypothetical protein
VPSSEALFIIKSAWKLPTNSALFEFMLENSYSLATGHLADPFQNNCGLMLAIYKLALVTRNCADEAKVALTDAFAAEDQFDKRFAAGIFSMLTDRFAGGD